MQWIVDAKMLLRPASTGTASSHSRRRSARSRGFATRSVSSHRSLGRRRRARSCDRFMAAPVSRRERLSYLCTVGAIAGPARCPRSSGSISRPRRSGQPLGVVATFPDFCATVGASRAPGTSLRSGQARRAAPRAPWEGRVTLDASHSRSTTGRQSGPSRSSTCSPSTPLARPSSSSGCRRAPRRSDPANARRGPRDREPHVVPSVARTGLRRRPRARRARTHERRAHGDHRTSAPSFSRAALRRRRAHSRDRVETSTSRTRAAT